MAALMHHFFLAAVHLHPAPQKELPTESVILAGDSIVPVSLFKQWLLILERH
jgi:hypothetical protein